jgi:hypothetical protein
LRAGVSLSAASIFYIFQHEGYKSHIKAFFGIAINHEKTAMKVGLG